MPALNEEALTDEMCFEVTESGVETLMAQDLQDKALNITITFKGIRALHDDEQMIVNHFSEPQYYDYKAGRIDWRGFPIKK
jgi:hypothetical protein